MFRHTRTTHPEVADTVPDEVQAPEHEAVPADLAAAAEDLRHQAATGREEIARQGEETQAELDEIARQVASLQAQAKSLSVTAGAEMTAKGRWVSGIEEKARYVAEADRHKVAGEEDLERASTLAAEREDLTGRVEGLESRLAHLDAEQQDVTRHLAAATETADVDLGASLRPRAEQLTAAIDSLTGQRDTLRARLEAIGTGQEHGDLYKALSAAGRHAGEHRKMLNLAYPDSPAARHAAAWDELQAIVLAQVDRITEEAAAAQRKPPQQIVHL